MKRPKLVEFLGLPGSGKTTTANKILPTLRADGHRFRVHKEVMSPLKQYPLRKIILGARLLWFVVRYRVAVIALLRLVWSLDNRTLKTYKSAVRVLQEALFIELAVGRAETDTLFLDQGLYQSLWYVVTYSHSFDSAAFEAVLDGLRPLLPSLVVGVRAAPEYACNRVVARGGVDCPFDRMPPSVSLTVFRRQVSVLHDYLPGVAKDRGAAVTQVGSNLGESEVRDLTRWISLHLAWAPAAQAAREEATVAKERIVMTLPLDEQQPDQYLDGAPGNKVHVEGRRPMNSVDGRKEKDTNNSRVKRLMRCILVIALFLASDSFAAEFLAGTCVHFEAQKTDPDEFWVKSQQLATNTFRTEIPWWDIERAKGQLAFPSSLEGVDRTINNAANRGAHPLIILGYGNQFYDAGSFPLSDIAQAAFVRYTEFVALRYKQKVRHYELWNEWNIGLSTGKPIPYKYSGSGKDYSRLLKKVYRAIKAIDPGAAVIAGAVANRDLTWINEMIDSADGEYDGISVHPYNYSNGWEGRTPEEAVQWLSLLHQVLPPSASVFVTEIGWPTYAGPHTTDKATVGDYLARFYLLSRAKPFIKGIWWYDFQDDGNDPADSEQNFGIVSRGYVPKPAFFAMRDVAGAVSQASAASTVELGNNFRAVRLVGKNGKTVLAVWSLQRTGSQTIVLNSAATRSELRLLEVGANHGVDTARVGKDLPPVIVSVTGRPWMISGDLDSLIIN